MKGPLSADRLFFISSLVFAISFVLYSSINYIWPVPVLSNELLAQLPPDPLMNPLSAVSIFSQISWMLSIAGVFSFVLGLIARRA